MGRKEFDLKKGYLQDVIGILWNHIAIIWRKKDLSFIAILPVTFRK